MINPDIDTNTEPLLPDPSKVSLRDAVADPKVSVAFLQAVERLQNSPANPGDLSAFSSFIDEQ